MQEEQNLSGAEVGGLNTKKKVFFVVALVAVIAIIAAFFTYSRLFGAPARNATHSVAGGPQKDVKTERFIVAVGLDKNKIVEKLKTDGFIKSAKGFEFAFKWDGGKGIQAGGYEISKAMNAWEIVAVLIQGPYMKWITIPEGLRKEEIADILAQKLNWSDEVKNHWIKVDTAARTDYIEGVYFPDTYLISEKETPADVAARLQRTFQEKFAPYSTDALKQNLKWDTMLKVTSLVQREAAGTGDMPLIAGVIWNRLTKGMKLDIDATVQYARGDTGQGWWAPLKTDDKKMVSPYNTYLNKGLPPHPISNPGIEAIKAVIYPEQTECFYYLHDKNRAIHCAKTYEEHKVNIAKYLR